MFASLMNTIYSIIKKPLVSRAKKMLIIFHAIEKNYVENFSSYKIGAVWFGWKMFKRPK